MWVEDKHELDKLKMNALTAIDKLKSIVAECDRVRAYVPYMQKKIEDAESSVQYIASTCKDNMEEKVAV